jgi:hypothetical protein
MYFSHWLEDTPQPYVSLVTLTIFIKELRKIVMDVIALIMNKPEPRIIRPRGFQPLVIAVISLLIPIGAILNLIISNFSLWSGVIPLRSVLAVIKVEYIVVHRVNVTDVIDPIMNHRKTRIIVKRAFLQLATLVTK